MKRLRRTRRNMALMRLAATIVASPFSLVRVIGCGINRAGEWVEDRIIDASLACFESVAETKARSRDILRSWAGQWLTVEMATHVGYPSQAGAWVCGCGMTWGHGLEWCTRCRVDRPPLDTRPERAA